MHFQYRIFGIFLSFENIKKKTSHVTYSEIVVIMNSSINFHGDECNIIQIVLSMT